MAFLAALFVFAMCAASHASNTSGAEVLFEAGRKALADQNYELACQKFEESNRLERAAGTVLNIGNCEEKQGRVASSWARYTEAMDMLGPEDPRYAFAKRKAEAIEGRVPRLTVTLAKDAPAGTRLTRDGQRWTEPLGMPLRLDPQTYVIVVSAPGYESASYEVTLHEGESKEITVGPGGSSAQATEEVSRPLVETDRRKPKRVGLIVGGAGAAALLTGIGFGVAAGINYQTVRQECDFEARTCGSEKGDKAARRGGAFEALAYGFGSLGVVGLGVGAYFLLREDEARGTSTALELEQVGGVSTLRLRTTF